MHRRSFLAGAATLPLAAPAIAAAPRLLRFVPNGEPPVLDPIPNTVLETRIHATMIYDTLYGMDASYKPAPQMLEGHDVTPDFKLWTLKLRPGLKFHDGEPVLARDVTASLRRWGKIDGWGRTLFAVTDELSEPDDRTIRFRLGAPYPLLPDALGKMSPNLAVIMPARLAATPPNVPVTDFTGSGPFRFRTDERVPGARLVYERFDGYVPRESGVPGFTSEPKRVFLDRVEWLVMPEPATSASALQRGEVDWIEMPSPDLLPLLRTDANLVVRVNDQTGSLPVLRFNCIQPPFDDPAIRRIVLAATQQKEFLAAFSSDTSLQRTGVGAYCPGTPDANDAGIDRVGCYKSIDEARQALARTAYKGEKTVVLGASDHPVNGVTSTVAVDLLKRIGLNAELRDMDAATMFQARANRNPVDQGGWSIFPTSVPGIDSLNPLTSTMLRGDGKAGWFGWPTDPLLEQLRLAWLNEPDPAKKRSISKQVQQEALDQALFMPLGQVLQPTAYRKGITGLPPGFAKFWGVQKG